MRQYAYHAQLGTRTKALNLFRGFFRIGPVERWLQRRLEHAPVDTLWGKLMAPEYTYPRGSWRMLERDGLKFRLDLSNAVDHAEYFGYRDLGEQRFAELIRPDDTVVDVGGNIGVRALHLSRLVPQGRIISLEPDRGNYARLQEHLKMNEATNVVALNVGIGAEERMMKLYQVEEHNSGMNRIILQGEGLERIPFQEIRIMPLAQALEGVEVDRVNAIKVDVEGFEMEVLRGAEPVIRRDQPELFIELDDDNLRDNGSTSGELVAYLGTLGYAVLDSRNMEVLSPNLDFTKCHFDVICTSRRG